VRLGGTEKTAAVVGAAAIVASLLLIPWSGGASADTADPGSDASSAVSTACLASGSVNVELNDPASGLTATTYQVSLAGPSRDANQFPDGGGPSLVSVGSPDSSSATDSSSASDAPSPSDSPSESAHALQLRAATSSSGSGTANSPAPNASSASGSGSSHSSTSSSNSGYGSASSTASDSASASASVSVSVPPADPGSGDIKVRLAGPVYSDDHVTISGDGALATDDLSITPQCKHGDFPNVVVPTPVVAAEKAPQCSADNGVGILATVKNKAQLTPTYMDQTGLDSVDYTVLLVRKDNGTITGDGALLQFSADKPSETVDAVSNACFSVPSTQTAAYEVRAISVTGAVVKTAPVTVLAARPPTSPASSSTPPPVQTVPPTKPVVPPTSAPSHSTPSGSTSSSSTANPSSSSTVAVSNSSGSTGSNGSSANGGGFSAQNGGSNGGQVGDSPSSNNEPQTAPVGSRGSASATPSADAASPALAPSPSPSGQSETVLRLAGPPIDAGSGIFNWQSGPAVIVAVVALAISGLIGSVLWSAKRR
jgi:hypothetical protein